MSHYQSTLPEQELLDTVREEYSLINAQSVESDNEEAALRESQLRNLSDKVKQYDSYRHYFTWEIMKSLFDEIQWRELPAEEWNSTIQRKCKEYSRKLNVNFRRLMTGSFNIVSTIIAADASAYLTLKTPSLNSIEALFLVGVNIVAKASSVVNFINQQPALSNEEVVEARAKRLLSKKLLTNVSTLRKDLNGGKAHDDKQTD